MGAARCSLDPCELLLERPLPDPALGLSVWKIAQAEPQGGCGEGVGWSRWLHGQSTDPDGTAGTEDWGVSGTLGAHQSFSCWIFRSLSGPEPE